MTDFGLNLVAAAITKTSRISQIIAIVEILMRQGVSLDAEALFKRAEQIFESLLKWEST